MKVLLISPNGLHELSGGGLYLRAIAGALCDIASIDEVTVISKDMKKKNVFHAPSHCHSVYVKKNARLDILGRLKLSPTYLINYFDKILNHVQNADLVLFHNSRCGVLFNKIKKIKSEKCYGIISDNVEAELKRQHINTNIIKKFSNFVEVKIIQRSEKMSAHADFLTFITKKDRVMFESLYGLPEMSGILPVSISRTISKRLFKADKYKDNISIIFTGHFGFAPNRKALSDFISVAREFRRICTIQVEFTAAGAQVGLFTDDIDDVTVIDSPSPEEMAEVFSAATVYLAPVSWGSGMKTKVAESLSYGLPVICLPNAAEGYDEALANPEYLPAIQIVQTIEEMAVALKILLSNGNLLERQEAAYAAFDALYSAQVQSDRLEKLINT